MTIHTNLLSHMNEKIMCIHKKRKAKRKETYEFYRISYNFAAKIPNEKIEMKRKRTFQICRKISISLSLSSHSNIRRENYPFSSSFIFLIPGILIILKGKTMKRYEMAVMAVCSLWESEKKNTKEWKENEKNNSKWQRKNENCTFYHLVSIFYSILLSIRYEKVFSFRIQGSYICVYLSSLNSKNVQFSILCFFFLLLFLVYASFHFQLHKKPLLPCFFSSSHSLL